MPGLKRVAGLIVALVVALPTVAQAGGIGNGGGAKVASSLGLVLPARQQTFKVGESFDCRVAAPAKLGAHGLAGLTPNQTVRVKVTGAHEFTVTVGRASATFTVDEQGALKRK